MPAKDKSNNNSNNSHSTLSPSPSPFQPPALAHRIALSASGVALRPVLVVAVVAAFLLATRKKSNKNNCHFPPPPSPPLRHAALPSTNGLPTRLQLTSHSRSQLNSTHLTSLTLGQSPKIPSHPTPILHSQYPLARPAARRMPNASQTIHKTRHSAVCQLICRRHPLWPRLIPILSSSPHPSPHSRRRVGSLTPPTSASP